MSWLNPNEGNQEFDPSDAVFSQSPTGDAFADNLLGQYRVAVDNTTASFNKSINEEFQKSIAQISGMPGGPQPYEANVTDQALHSITGMPLPWYASAVQATGLGDYQDETNKVIAVNNYIKSLKNAKIKSIEDIVQEQKAKRQTDLQNAQIATAQGGFGSAAGGFIGGFAGSMTDPINLATMGFGGFGKSAALRIASEAGIFGAVNAARTAAFTNPQHLQAGEPTDNVLQAGEEGVLYGALARTLGEAGHAVFGRFFKPRDDAPAISEPTEGLGELAKLEPENPQARAVNYALDLRQAFDEATPYPKGQNGDLQFIADMNHVVRNFPDRGETAIYQNDIRSQPIDATGYLSMTPDELAQIQTRPDLSHELKANTLDAKDVQWKILSLGDESNSFKLSELLEHADPKQSEQAAKAEGILSPIIDQGLEPKGQKELRAVNTLENLYDEHFPNGTADRNFYGTALNLTRHEAEPLLQRGLDNIQSKIDEVHGKIQDFKTEYGQKQIARRWLEAVKAQDAAGRLDAMREGLVNPDPNLRPEEALAASKEVTEALPQISDAKLTSAVESLKAEEGLVDLGNGRMMKADTLIPTADGRGGIVMLKASDVIKDLENDRAMVEAMGSCSL